MAVRNAYSDVQAYFFAIERPLPYEQEYELDQTLPE